MTKQNMSQVLLLCVRTEYDTDEKCMFITYNNLIT